MNKFKKVISFVLMLVLVCSMALVTGCGKKSSDKEDSSKTEGTADTSINYSKDDVAVTIDGDKLTMAEMLYYIYSYESQIDYMDKMYQYYFNTGYWDMEIEEGKTVRQDSKNQTMDTAIRYEVLYREAMKKDYKLSDEELETIKTNSASAMEQISAEQLALTGFTEDAVYEIQQKWAIADKYYEDLIKSFNINEDAIKAGVDKDQYKEYSTEYIMIPTVSTDDQGNSTPLSDKEKAEAKKKIDAIYDKVKDSKDMEKALPEDSSEFNYSDLSFLPNDENETADKTYMKEAMKLKNDEISGVVEAEDGYYIIKMIDTDATTSYDEAVEAAIQDAENARFEEEFKTLEKNYNVVINDKVWDKVTMGNNTIPVVAEGETTNDSALTDGLSIGGDDSTSTDDTTTDGSTTDDSGTK